MLTIIKSAEVGYRRSQANNRQDEVIFLCNKARETTHKRLLRRCEKHCI